MKIYFQMTPFGQGIGINSTDKESVPRLASRASCGPKRMRSDG